MPQDKALLLGVSVYWGGGEVSDERVFKYGNIERMVEKRLKDEYIYGCMF